MNKEINDIKNKITPIFSEFNVSKASIFGSYATGDFTDKSDVDLLVTFEKPITLVQFFRLKEDLKKVLNRDVDIVSNNSIISPLKKYILSESVEIYDKG